MFLVTFYMPRMWYNRRGLHLRRGGHKGRPQPPHPLQQNAFFLTIPPTVVNCKVKVNLCALQTVDWGGEASISLNPYSLFLYCSICVVWRGAAGGFGPWRPCWPQIQENHCLNLLKSLFSSQTMYSETGHTLVFCVIKCIRILMVCFTFCDQFTI